MEIHSYSQADHGETVAAWWEAHNERPFQSAMLPPVGVVATDDSGLVAACWLHLSAGVGVCFIENPVTRPGLTVVEARDALTALLAALEAVALTHDYGVMVCHTMPAIARYLRGKGFAFSDRTFLTGTKLLR